MTGKELLIKELERLDKMILDYQNITNEFIDSDWTSKGMIALSNLEIAKSRLVVQLSEYTGIKYG